MMKEILLLTAGLFVSILMSCVLQGCVHGVWKEKERQDPRINTLRRK